MKISLLVMALIILVSCRGREKQEVGEASDPKSRIRSESTIPGEKTPTGEGRRTANMSKVDRFISELKKSSNSGERREMFAEMMLELSTEEHEVAVEVAIADLNSAQPANLVSEYLEMSSLMSPALQLPGIVRLLEEPKLLPLQRAAMEQQLRQDLGVPAGEIVNDWRLLVADHLRKDEELIAE